MDDLQMREQISLYLDGELTLQALNRTVAPVVATGGTVPEVALEVATVLAEYARGDRTEENLRTQLLPLVTQYAVAWDGVASVSGRLESTSDSAQGSLLSSSTG